MNRPDRNFIGPLDFPGFQQYDMISSDQGDEAFWIEIPLQIKQNIHPASANPFLEAPAHPAR